MASSPAAGLTTTQVSFYHDNGYLVIPDALSPRTVSTLLQETHRMLNEDLDIKNHPMTKFSTGEGEDGGEHVGDEYFLESGDKVRFFFEEDAFDPTTSQLKSSPSKSINKIGHSLHTLSPLFRQISLSPENASIAHSLQYKDPRILQSMVICKQPEIGGAVPSHQDSTFLYTDPPSAVGFWYALEDATLGNGCLSMLPGSHKTAKIKKRFVRREGGNGTTFIENEGAMFPATTTEDGHAAAGNGVPKDNEQQEYTLAPVKAGSLVLIHGNLLHKSEANRSDKSRFIYTFHMIEGSDDGTRHVYDEKNWLQPTKEGFSRLYGEGGMAMA